MKLGLSVVAAQFLALAGTLPLSAQDIPASSVMPPGYLQAMPSADRVLSDMKVADSVETRARRIAAMTYLGEIMDVLTWDHLYVQAGSGLTPEEDSLTRGYRNAWNDLFYHSGDVPGLTALMTRYEAESSPLRSEILDRYFSPAWKAALMALDARYRVVENAPPTVQAEQRAPPATGQAEQRVPYFANLRCTPGATGAHGKPVSGLEKEACDMAMAEIGKHWAKQPDGWTTALSEETGFAPIDFIRQVRSLAVERVKTYELSAADNMNGFEWAGEVWFNRGPMREAGDPGLVSGRTVSVMRRQGQWSQWVDYQPLPLRVQRVNGKWEVDPHSSLLEGKQLPGAADVAIPKFANTNAEAYVASMKSDLRNLVTAEEAFFAYNSGKYSGTVSCTTPPSSTKSAKRWRQRPGARATAGTVNFCVTTGNILGTIGLAAGNGGWSATITNTNLQTPLVTCAIFINTAPVAPATAEGAPACQ